LDVVLMKNGEYGVKLRIAGGATAFAFLLLCVGCSSKPSPAAPADPHPGADLMNPTELNANSIAQGKILYHASDCALCHGKEGDGKGFDARDTHMNVHDWRNADYTKKFMDGELYNVMANGKDRMPAYGTRNTPNEIWLMVDYIRSMGMN
jgi:mono/diheme cytochrome c family protein